MSPQAQTAKQVSESLFALMPRAISPAALEEYGIEVSVEQAVVITREVLSVNLFWVYSALETLLTVLERERVLLELLQLVGRAWVSEFGFKQGDVVEYFEKVDARRVAYDQVVRAGGEPVSVFGEAAAILETNKVIDARDRNNILALLIDLVPVDSYGDVLEDIDLIDATA